MREALVVVGVWVALAAWRDWPGPWDVLRLLTRRRRRVGDDGLTDAERRAAADRWAAGPADRDIKKITRRRP